MIPGALLPAAPATLLVGERKVDEVFSGEALPRSIAFACRLAVTIDGTWMVDLRSNLRLAVETSALAC